MRAVVIETFRDPPRLVDVPDPQPPAHGVVVAVAATGVCRSDWHAWQGHDADVTLPHVPGHELAGTVVAVGADVRTDGWATSSPRRSSPPAASAPSAARATSRCARADPARLHRMGLLRRVRGPRPRRRQSRRACHGDLGASLVRGRAGLPGRDGVPGRHRRRRGARRRVGRPCTAAAGSGWRRSVSPSRPEPGWSPPIPLLRHGHWRASSVPTTSSTPPRRRRRRDHDLTGGGAAASFDAVGAPGRGRGVDPLPAHARPARAGRAAARRGRAAGRADGRRRRQRAAGAGQPRDGRARLPRLLALVAAGRLPLARLVGRTLPLDAGPDALAEVGSATAAGVTVLRP